MNHQLDSLSSPLPQVGAVLELDTDLDVDGIEQGNKHWILRGSCALVAPDRVLTIVHILDLDPGIRSAVFLPYEGIFLLSGESLKEPQKIGDNLALVRLLRRVPRTPPLGYRRIRSRYKYTGYAEAAGYGLWRGGPHGDLDGLQQRFTVDLGPPPRGSGASWQRYDNLDLSWSSAMNGGLVAGRDNSGGPMLWGSDGGGDGGDGFDVVGIHREEKGDQQIGSWIGKDRRDWLAAQNLGGDPPEAEPVGRFTCPVLIEARIRGNGGGSPRRSPLRRHLERSFSRPRPRPGREPGARDRHRPRGARRAESRPGARTAGRAIHGVAWFHDPHYGIASHNMEFHLAQGAMATRRPAASPVITRR